ncbi:MAG: pyridoxamine 5'-phosphate oxidase [Flavobacteriaceae bacterium]|nr:pyridoxamine 5'-phosphate oxidase [Flavobacteriaceae bacterium]
MKESLHDYRKSYEKGALVLDNLDPNPLQQFRKWFHEVDESESVDEANAFSLSTIGEDGFPKTRVVLLKSYNENGFVFYTNYESEKGRSIALNNKVCCSFFWPAAERQIIIKGTAEKLSNEVSDAYFSSRPRGSQLGAMVSHQSEVIEDRNVLENQLKELEDQHHGKELERPDYWGGFLVRPVSIEFWQGRPNRLHDRFRFTLEDYDWKIERLAP